MAMLPRLIGAATLVAVVLLAAVADACSPIESQAPGADKNAPVELTQQQTEARVRADAARRAQVAEDAVRIVESAARTWPDRRLGCTGQRGVFEPEQIPGYLVVVEAAGRRLQFHTDRHGRLLQCTPPPKPIDRIQ